MSRRAASSVARGVDAQPTAVISIAAPAPQLVHRFRAFNGMSPGTISCH
jgi:hypothetical protein